VCQRLWSNGNGVDTVVVAQVNTLYVWPSDEPTQLPWNNGSGNFGVVLSNDTTVTATALLDMSGMAETNTLVGLTGLAAPYGAATACRAHGPDWYLPAMGELNIVTTASGAGTVGSLTMSHSGSFAGYYWATTEATWSTAFAPYYSGGAWHPGYNPKSDAFSVRCVRR